MSSVSRSSRLLDNERLVEVKGQLKGGSYPTTGRVASITFILSNPTNATWVQRGRDIFEQLDLANKYSRMCFIRPLPG